MGKPTLRLAIAMTSEVISREAYLRSESLTRLRRPRLPPSGR